ncbi:MAG: 2-C-methyl-D-erythritol 2,4-cyclodiphosphate synthase [Marinilabiliales bacterium]|nr:MAG: 2-C-methyl-D-erythritol 2,4-cyclodiphosphate synthase [Marinilabiliales bacterium]
MSVRIGYGYDVHQLADGRELYLGGIKIPHSKGCIAHSDGDVLLHAICDAILGAAAMRDIGYHFPDTDPAYKNIDSKVLLKKTYQLISAKGYSLINIDSTVCLEKPKIKDYIDKMTQCIADQLYTSIENVSVKATTTEKLGFVGREEGIAAHAVVLIEKVK